MATSIAAKGATLEAGTPMVLFQPRIAGGGAFTVGARQQDNVAPDGRFLINIETGIHHPTDHAAIELEAAGGISS